MTESTDLDVSKSPPKKKIKTTPKKKINRCTKCNCKIGLLGIKCRCDYSFCSKCIPSNVHNCTFDYKQMQKDDLTKNLKNGNFKKITGI